MLPHDFDIRKHAVRMGAGQMGVNYSGRWGNRHVKEVDEPAHIVGPGVSNFLRLAGVPHVPVQHAFRGDTHLLHSPWVDGKPLDEATQEELKQVSVPHAMHTLLGEWLADVGDRHGGNYLLKGKHILPIDFDLTGIPGGYTPLGGALMHALRRYHPAPVRPSTRFPEVSVRRLVQQGEALRKAHRIAMAPYGTEHAKLLADAFDSRLKHLAAAPTHDVPLSHLFEHK